jgi:hypothetical protein
LAAKIQVLVVVDIIMETLRGRSRSECHSNSVSPNAEPDILERSAPIGDIHLVKERLTGEEAVPPPFTELPHPECPLINAFKDAAADD